GRMSRLGTSRRRGISLPFLLQLARAFALASGATDLWGHPLTRQTAVSRNMPGQIGRALDSSGLLRALGAVLRAGLLAILDALQVERTTDDVVTHTRQVLHPA